MAARPVVLGYEHLIAKGTLEVGENLYIPDLPNLTQPPKDQTKAAIGRFNNITYMWDSLLLIWKELGSSAGISLTFDNIASMKAVRGVTGLRVITLSYSSFGDEGGGFFYWDAASTAADNGFSIFLPTVGSGAGRWMRIYNPAEMYMAQFGVDRTGVSESSTKFELALSLGAADGVNVYWPQGKFLSGPNSWRVYRSNVRIFGAGIDKTILDTPSNASEGLAFSQYRYGGWDFDPTHIFTYEDSVFAGQGYVDLKTGTGQADLALLTPNTRFFLGAGASFYDQGYGQNNEVDKLIGNRLHVRQNWDRDYTAARSSWYGTLAADFTVPAIGSTGVAVFQNDAVLPSVGTGFISLGNELFQVTARTGVNVTLRNLGKGNTSTTILAGTRVYKYRAIILTPSCSRNIEVHDLTIIGHRKSLVISNSMHTYMNRVKTYRKVGDVAGGGWIDGDGGYGFKAEACRFESEVLINGQLARSFGNAKFQNCEFIQVMTENSEFNFDVHYRDSSFDCHYEVPGDETKVILNLGSTTSNISVTNCTFKGDGITSIMNSSDIQTYSNACASDMYINGCTLIGNKVQNGLDIYRAGTVRVNDIKFQGSFLKLMGASGALSYGTTNQVDQNEKAVFGCQFVIDGFRADVYTDYIFNRGETNLEWRNFDVNLFGPYDPAGFSSDAIGNGNIVRNGGSPPAFPIERMIIGPGTFRNWPYHLNSLSITGTRDMKWESGKVVFISTHPASSIRPGDTFIFNDFSADTIRFGNNDYNPSVRSVDVDLSAFQDWVRHYGGSLTAAQVSACRDFINGVYNNGLRDYLPMVHLAAGDNVAMDVPIFGWQLTDYKRLYNVGGFLTKGANGYTGSVANSAYGIFGRSNNFDPSDFGLFAQITVAPSSATQTYLGRFVGNVANGLRLNQNGSILQGIGAVNIATSYTPGVGFIYSGLKAVGGVNVAGSNMLDATNLKQTNTSMGTLQQTTTNSILTLLAAASSTTTTGAASFSGATIGAYGVTRYMPLPQVRALRTLVYRLMVAFGRPVQETSPGVPLVPSNVLPNKATWMEGFVFDTSGTGSPDGVYEANPGSTYRQIDGTAGSYYWVKQIGTDANGWVPIA